MNAASLIRSLLWRFSVLCLSSAAVLAVAQPADIRQGLVSYWPLDGNDGGMALDWGVGNAMTIVGAPLVEPGRVNNAFTFDGATTYLTNLHSPDNTRTGLPIYRAGSYTITMWVKGPAQTANYLYSEASVDSNNPLLILQSGQAAANNARFDVIIRTDGNVALLNHVVSTNVVFDDTWHHIAWVDDLGNARLYVDGNLDPANFNYAPSGTFTFNTAAIGTLVRQAISTAAVFMGQIDDLATWERPLTQAEVQQVMNSSLVTVPAFITKQPTGGTRGLGDRITMVSRAMGTPPITYQWFKGGTLIPDATANWLSLSNLVESDSGNYTVQVSNVDGSLTSEVAVLTVLPDPVPDVRRGLISYWPMDDITMDQSGGNVTPDLYSQNTMRLVTSAFFDQTIGAFGTAIIFNGTEQYGFRMGGFPIYPNGVLTVSIWINGGPQADGRFFCESSTNNNNSLFSLGSHTSPTNLAMRVCVTNDSGILALNRFSTRPVLDSNWHHVVWVESNGVARLYIDGQLDETDFNYARGVVTPNQTAVAASVRAAVSSFFTGAIDELALWNRQLTFSEIQQIHTTGVPPPIMQIPPEITSQPLSQSVLTRSKVTFSATATGTSPLEAQWRKNGTTLAGETNFTLMFNNITLADAADYDIVVANAAGRATSQVATLTVTLRPPAPAVLKVDFNQTNAPPADNEPGFSEFTIGPHATPGITGPIRVTFGGVDVTLVAVGTTMESRKRLQPTNQVDFTQERLLQDFVFTRDAAVDQGLDIAVEFLEPNQAYAVSIWSFDNGSVGMPRVSDWTANGVLVQGGYSFLGSDLPTTNERYRFGFDATADVDGKILIQGRRSASAGGTINVFINALQIARRELKIQRVELAGPEGIRIFFEVLDINEFHRVDRRADLQGDWAEVQDALFQAPIGNAVEVFIPTHGAPAGFYRVVQLP